MLCLHPPFSTHDSLALSSYTLSPFQNGAFVSRSRPLFQKAMAIDGPLPMDSQGLVSGSGMSHKSRVQASRAVSLRDESSLLIPSTWVFGEATSLATDSSISCTTFNILAPIYKRVNGEGFRESQFRESWLSRNQKILDMLLFSESSIICLQELWLGNEELTRLYEESLCQADYLTYKLARTNNRGDGLLTAIKSASLRVLDYKKLHFHDCGDRVAQVFHVQSRVPCLERSQSAGSELLLVNTHLLFPHDFNYCLVRLRQVFKILKFIEQYRIEHGLTSIPVILCGDWNGSKRGRVYKFLRSQGYLSSYDTVRDYSDADSRRRWISHRNHRGNICEVDFIWLLNPGTDQKPLLVSWHEAVLGTINARLSQLGLDGRDAFSFFKSKNGGSVMTLEEFQQGLRQLGLTEACVAECSEGLTDQEIEQLMQVVDIDGNGVIDYDEFKMLLGSEGADVTVARKAMAASRSSVDLAISKDEEEEVGQLVEKKGKLERLGSFVIKDASLFPPEAEDGVWPEEYSLSDHAALTVTFTSPRNSSDVY